MYILLLRCIMNACCVKLRYHKMHIYIYIYIYIVRHHGTQIHLGLES